MTDAHIVNNVHPRPGVDISFSFSSNPARLHKSDYDLFLIQRIRIVKDEENEDSWRVTTLSYEYAVERRSDGQEVIAFHWEGRDAANRVPHLHIGFAVDHQGPVLGSKSHVPTGRVLIEDLVHFLVRELGVKPTPPRTADWQDVIASARQNVMACKSW